MAMRRLTEDGEIKEIKPEFWKHMRIKVLAHRYDSETPFVILQFLDYDGTVEYERSIEDCFAAEIQKMIGKALDILPTSK
jgi:hypothetical protein